MILLQSGALIADRFVVERPADSGGMGTIYRARDRFTGVVVALKLLHADNTDVLEEERFAREAQLLAELRHPGIVSYVDHGRTADGRRFLAMEWLEGENLACRIAHGPLSLRESLLVQQQVAAALALAHQRGIVHRDPWHKTKTGLHPDTLPTPHRAS